MRGRKSEDSLVNRVKPLISGSIPRAMLRQKMSVLPKIADINPWLALPPTEDSALLRAALIPLAVRRIPMDSPGRAFWPSSVIATSRPSLSAS
ncbi:Uncharacterised protein [Mycobacteroides abscessus subsp. abscessus]|nr:Uncharacterised protein [Mycobacteroides abscessus subsp. abscessus]